MYIPQRSFSHLSSHQCIISSFIFKRERERERENRMSVREREREREEVGEETERNEKQLKKLAKNLCKVKLS